MQRHEWIKVRLMWGVKTNIVTSIEIADQHCGDCPQFKGLVNATARNFVINEVSADKAYLSSDNLQTVADHNAMPYIAFKANSLTSKNHSAIWERAVHFYCLNQRPFLHNYPQPRN